MHDKKKEYDKLFEMHIFELWERDLDRFLLALDDYEEQEEKDRRAHGSLKNDGKKKRKPQQKKQNV